MMLKTRCCLSVITFLIFIAVSYQEKKVPIPKEANDNNNSIVCGEEGDCPSVSLNCNEKCGCDNAYYYNETTGECTISKYLMKTLVEKYNPQDPIGTHESILAKMVRLEADRIFRGFLIAAIFILTCASFCTLAACIYCGRIKISDNSLRKDVEALAKKLGRNQIKNTKTSLKTPPIAENCTVIVNDVMVM